MITYFKSMVNVDNILQTQTFEPSTQKRNTCQTLDEVLYGRTLKPNTRHRELKQRLCVSAITPEYNETHKSEGIIFESNDAPSYATPFDLMMLTESKTFTSGDYDSSFLPDYQKLVYSNAEDMLKNNPESAVKKLKEFRKEHGLEEITVKKYNEVCFEKDIVIQPKAIIGTSEDTRNLATRYNLPNYGTIDEYMQVRKPSMVDFTRKSVVGALFRVGSSFAIDATTYLAVTGGNWENFAQRFQWDKFLTVSAAVVAINFLDYKLDITNKLDKFAKRGINGISNYIQSIVTPNSQ
jgi:hypothetical protein